MHYALSSSLGSMSGLNTDKLALDLQFATDKTLTARRGPTPTFTRASTATFVGSNGLIQSAAINAARFDHDPVTLACKGLLIEEARTNLFPSTNLNDWPTARCTKTPITGIGLTNQASTLTVSDIGSTYISRGVTLTTGVAYAISVRVKAGTVSGFSFADLTDGKYSRNFNLSTSQWPASGGAPEFTNYTVTPNIDGWFLVSVIYTPTGATGVKNIAFLLNSTILGQTVSFDTPQIEAGSFPTSYIPTTTASVVRSADVCSITGSSFTSFYNQSEGTLFADATPQTVAQTSVVVATNTIVANDQNGIFKVNATFSGNGLRWGGTTSDGSTTQANILTSTDVAVSRSKLAYAFKLNDFVLAYAGTIVGTDNSGTVGSPTKLNIGGRDGLLYINGHIARVSFYKKRVSNSRLQKLTT